MVEKIHENYRISYLKDTALATGLEETNIPTINTVLNNNNQRLIETILLDQENIVMIFESLRNETIEKRKEAIAFISELFSISKNLQLQGRLNLISTFKNIEGYNLLTFVSESINLNSSNTEESKDQEDTERWVNNALDILYSYLQSFPVTLNELTENTPDTGNSLTWKDFISLLIKHMLESEYQSVKLQIHEFIKFLLDSGDSLILSYIYDYGFTLIWDFFWTEEKEGDNEYNNNICLAKSLGIDIINKALTEDNYNVKNHVSSLGLIERIWDLDRFNNKLLNIGIVKFYKTLISTTFKPYITKIIQSECLDSVIKIYENLPNRRNMTGSIVLELFSKINRNEYYQLAKFLCDKHEVVRPFLKDCASKYDPKVRISIQ